MPTRAAKEEARERETFRYDQSLIHYAVRSAKASDDHVSSRRPKPASDPALTAFAELGVLRLSGCSAHISLFDSKHQYVIAEATPSTKLRPSPSGSNGEQADQAGELGAERSLLGTAIMRPDSICDHVLIAPLLGQASAIPVRVSDPSDDLPVSIIGDIAKYPSLMGEANRLSASFKHFYVGVPLRTPQGIDIGVLCVMDLEPREQLDPSLIQVMRDLSHTTMAYLETRRLSEDYRRAGRMVRGVGSFVEGETTTTGWEAHSNAKEVIAGEGALNTAQQELQSKHAHEKDSKDKTELAFKSGDKKRSRLSDDIDHAHASSYRPNDYIFAKAANIIRESIEVEGVLFLDAGISSFGGRAAVGGIPKTPSISRTASSESQPFRRGPVDDPRCRVLGFSTSSLSSIDGTNVRSSAIKSQKRLPEHVLDGFLERYAAGTIFNFTGSGTFQPDSVYGDQEDAESPASEVQFEDLGANAPDDLPFDADMARFTKDMLPDARSVAFFPLWDPQKQRWYAGGFAYTKNASRTFSVEGELSYLMAFGTIIMAEVFRLDTKLVERSKTDVLSSVSHELRSPLHGIILGAELLRDTALDAFQGDLLHSMETCSRTLLDTVDHLLDWSGVNNFLSGSADGTPSKGSSTERGLRSGKVASIESGMMSITSCVNLDLLVEEVIESVYAGRVFQLRSLGSGTNASKNNTDALHRLDSMQASELLGKSALQRDAGIAAVGVDIEPSVSWAFYTQPGAIRRIVMNLVGNSLKFTTQGFVKVVLDQPDLVGDDGRNETYVRLTVTDSGCGIGKSYLENDIFTPFAQEDSLKPGTGLGLSFVERIVTALKGSITVESIVNKGTCVSVILPLIPVAQSESIPQALSPMEEFDAQRADLQGLRVLLLGFNDRPSVDSEDGVFGSNVIERDAVASICRDWLKMEVLEDSHSDTVVPDLLLYDENYLHLSSRRPHNASSPPAVVICRSTVSARRLAETRAFKRSSNRQMWEFSSQPIGPRKLAKVLALTFKRWTKHQASLNPTPLSIIHTPEDEDGQSVDDSASAETPTDEASPQDVSTSDTSVSDQSTTSQASHKKLYLPERIRKATPLTPTFASFDASSNTSEFIEATAAPEQLPTKFLLVDDNPINLKILTTYMKKLRLPYTTAMNGQQAVDAFAESAGQFKCVFMDISMPVMDGFQATRLIRAIETERGVGRCVIFALTGLASADAQHEAFTSGIDLFLTKPVKLAELSQIMSARNLA